MAITLADAAVNTLDDVDLTVIDEFRKSSFLLNALQFDQCVNPAGGGATLTYGYTRHITERSAAFRQQNTEYAAEQAKRQRYTVDLAPLGGKFSVDRVLAHMGPAASDEVSYQLSQLIKATVARFSDEFINGTAGDFANAAPGFDGLDTALTGTATESTGNDWTSITSQGDAIAAATSLNKWLRTLNGRPDVIIGGNDGIAKLEELAMWAGAYTIRQDEFGREVGMYKGIPLVDLQEKDGSSAPIVGTSTPGTGVTGDTSLYAVRFGLDAVHAVSTPGQLVRTWLPDFTTSGAVKDGEAEMGPVATVLKSSKGAGVYRVSVLPATA